jgi:ribosome-binding protein aMBF1 (putative translation factor)
MIVSMKPIRKADQLASAKIFGAQIRAARALVGWSAAELAQEARLGLATIRRAEVHSGETAMTPANELAVQRALEAAGVEFIDENGAVRNGCASIRKTSRARSILR